MASFAVSGLVTTHVSAKPLNNRQLEKVATQLIETNAIAWGLENKRFLPQRVITTKDGLSTVRFKQIISGVKVLDSLVAITMNTDGKFISHTELVSGSTSVSPSQLSKNQVHSLALNSFATSSGSLKRNVKVLRVEKFFADANISSNLIKQSGIVWKVDLVDKTDVTKAASTFIADVSGQVLAFRNLVKKVSSQPVYPTPQICDLQTSQPSGNLTGRFSTGNISAGSTGTVRRNWVGQLSGYPLCEKSDPAKLSSSSDAVQSVDETVDFFWQKLGIDIASEYYLGNVSPLANFGKNVDAASYCNPSAPTANDASCAPVISGYTNVCAYDSKRKGVDCPMENAFWVPWNSNDCRSGACSGIFFGAGFDRADDVVAHELAHGVTGADAFFDGVCDSCDAGGISEALSDIFGEAVDQLYPRVSETPDPNWRMGEDVNGGPFRNMAMVGTVKSCSASSDWFPIKQIDATWDTTCDAHNSLGPADRLAWLLANGGKQNGITVKPIGIAPWGATGKYELCKPDSSNCTAIVNMARLFTQTLKKLNGNILYSSFGLQVALACTDLTQAKLNPFPASYCLQVKNALAATGIAKLSLVLTTRPTAVKPKTTVTVAGRFTATNAIPSAGTSVLLQFKATNTSTWTTLKSLTTSTSGALTTRVIFPKSGQYRLATVSNSVTGKYFSPVVSISVK